VITSRGSVATKKADRDEGERQLKSPALPGFQECLPYRVLLIGANELIAYCSRKSGMRD